MGSSARRGNLCLGEKMEQADACEAHTDAGTCAWLAWQAKGERALLLPSQMHINHLLGQYERRGGHVFVLQGWRANR